MADDELTERAARLRARSQHMRERVYDRTRANEGAKQQLASITGSAESSDGLIRATVDGNGMLTHLDLSKEVNRASTNELSDAITAVTQAAVANVRNQVRAVYVGLQNEGVIKDLPANLLPAPETASVQLTLQAPTPRRRPSTSGGTTNSGATTTTPTPAAPKRGDDEWPPASWMVRNPLEKKPDE